MSTLPYTRDDGPIPVQELVERAAHGSTKTRKFFNQVQPTFALDKPIATQLEFLDHSDPHKGKIVRKKAREWVTRNKSSDVARRKSQHDSGATRDTTVSSDVTHRATSLIQSRPAGIIPPLPPLIDISANRIDPFNHVFPAVGRPIDHIVEFFLTSCPEEVPCCDDQFAWRPHSLAVRPSVENSVLGTMRNERVSFVLWLHATTLIRDSMVGNWGSEEYFYYYKLALEEVQKAVTRGVNEYTDAFMTALACFTAAANFGGQFEAAEMHCDAMIRAVTLKGDGDLVKGMKQFSPFVQKSMQWCEFHVAAQIPAVPKLPYSPPVSNQLLPPTLVYEAERLTEISLSSMPALSEPFPVIVSQLHELSLSLAHSTPKNVSLRGYHRLDPSVSRPLYNTEFTLLQLLADQKESGTTLFSAFEILLTEACQMYIWTAIRMLPPAMVMCRLFVERLKAALLPFLAPDAEDEAEGSTESLNLSSISGGSTATTSPKAAFTPPRANLQSLDDVLIWALFLGTYVASVGPRPDYPWFKEQLRSHVHGIKKIKGYEDLRQVLYLFPCTETLYALGVAGLDLQFQAATSQ